MGVSAEAARVLQRVASTVEDERVTVPEAQPEGLLREAIQWA
jgi:hypothetical protein